MTTTPRQKGYYQREKKMFVNICVMLGALIVGSAAILFVWTNFKDNLNGNQIMLLFGGILIFFLLAGSLYMGWEQRYRQMVFDSENIEPNCYDVKEVGYKGFLNQVKGTHSVYSDPNELYHMITASYGGSSFKIFVSRTNMITADEASKMSLKCIEREEAMDVDLSQDKSYRVNIIFLDEYNISAKDLVSKNAAYTLAHDKYTSIIVDISEEKLYIPAHLGLKKMKPYVHMHDLLGKLFENYTKE